MTPEERAFLCVLALMSALQVAAVIVTGRSFLRRMTEILRARARGKRFRRRILPRPSPPRPIGFLAPLALRDSQPPPSSLSGLARPIEPHIHYPPPSVDTRGLVRPRCATRRDRG